jgi:predicted kinase
MKAVLLMCGLPGSGKSTWIKENKLEPYSISRDNLRLLYYGPLYNKYGLESMPYASEKLVYEEYMRIVEMRMRNNSFIVLDNTHLKVSSINSIVNLAEYYGYKVFIKVMDTSVTECLRRNKAKEYYKKV